MTTSQHASNADRRPPSPEELRFRAARVQYMTAYVNIVGTILILLLQLLLLQQ